VHVISVSAVRLWYAFVGLFFVLIYCSFLPQNVVLVNVIMALISVMLFTDMLVVPVIVRLCGLTSVLLFGVLLRSVYDVRGGECVCGCTCVLSELLIANKDIYIY